MRADANSSARPTTREKQLRARVRKSVIEHGYHKRKDVRPDQPAAAKQFAFTRWREKATRIVSKAKITREPWFVMRNHGEKLSRFL